jgi:hypothetical protein
MSDESPFDFSGNDRKPAKAKSGPWLWIALASGCLLALTVCCVGAGVGVYFLFFSGPSIVGKWEVTEKFPGGLDRRTWDFQRGGAGKLNIHGEVEGKSKDTTSHFEYKLIKGDPLLLEMKITKVEGDTTDRMKRELGETLRATVVLDGDTLRLTPQGKGEADTITLKRVR